MVRLLFRQYGAPMLARSICKILIFMVNSSSFIFSHVYEMRMADADGCLINAEGLRSDLDSPKL
jgi:hypothetical protein